MFPKYSAMFSLSVMHSVLPHSQTCLLSSHFVPLYSLLFSDCPGSLRLRTTLQPSMEESFHDVISFYLSYLSQVEKLNSFLIPVPKP